MAHSQSHIVGTWTLNLSFSKGPLSFSLQVTLPLSFIHRSDILPSPLSPFFPPPVFFFPFSAPLCLFWSIYLPPPLYHDLFLSALLWHFHLRLMATFPSLICSLHLLLLHSLCHGSFICSPLTLTDLSITTSLSVHFSLCSLIFTVSISPLPFISPFTSMFIHASIRGTRFNSQCSPHSVQPCRGLCALTCRRDLHVFFLFVCFVCCFFNKQLEAVKYLKFAIFKLAISFIL